MRGCHRMKLLRLSIYIGIVVIMVAGCQNEGAETDELTNQNPIQVKQSYENDKKQLTSSEVSEHLVELASRVPQVDGATAVVAGNYAVVGIDVNADLDRSKVSTIKYSVAEALRHDPYGANAVVTADPDIIERLNHMADKIQNGDPITGILDELAAIVGRIMPEIPAEIESNQAPTEQPDEQLPKNKEQQLEKQQQKQSKQEKGAPSQLKNE
jgi:YhcN/YlaJ family sporulation lipoprotein